LNVSFVLNGRSVQANVEPERRLVDVLRENFNLTRTKAGCYAGECGACSVLLDGELTLSCMVPAFAVRGSEVTTIEGFAQTRECEEIVRAFEEASYHPCGYCSGSRILATEALLQHNLDPSRREILLALSGISCQCSDYTSLTKAVALAAATRKAIRRGRRE
jgi:aerobic carbon-monoxide dehydrogenase small subunit